MGGGASKKSTNLVQEEASKRSPKAEIKPSNRSPSQSPQLPAILPQQRSVHSQASSLQNEVSTKRSTTNPSNGINRRIPFRKLDNNTVRENDDVPLPPIDNRNNKSHLPTSSVVPPRPINRPRLRSDSSSDSSKHSGRKSLSTIHEQIGRCSHCPHCQRVKNSRSISSGPKPKWLTKNPGPDQVHIAMDDYDVEAVKKKIISENGHLPGSYDYRPHLTIEQINEYDQTKENYYTQPMVAKTKPRILPSGTPFPDYDLLQRRDQRLNKPFTLSLFEN